MPDKVRLTMTFEFKLEPLTRDEYQKRGKKGSNIPAHAHFKLVNSAGCRIAWVADLAEAMEHVGDYADDVAADLGSPAEQSIIPVSDP